MFDTVDTIVLFQTSNIVTFLFLPQPSPSREWFLYISIRIAVSRERRTNYLSGQRWQG